MGLLDGEEERIVNEYTMAIDAKENAGRAIGKSGEIIKKFERMLGEKGHVKCVGDKAQGCVLCYGDCEETRDAIAGVMKALISIHPPRQGESRTVSEENAAKMKGMPHIIVDVADPIPTKNIEMNVDGVFVFSADPGCGEGEVDWDTLARDTPIESRESADSTWESGKFMKVTVREDGFPMLQIDQDGEDVLRKETDVRLRKRQIVILGETREAREKARDLCKEYAADPSLYESQGNDWGKKDSWKKDDDWKKKDSGNDWKKDAGNDWKKDGGNDWKKDAGNDWKKDGGNDWKKDAGNDWKKDDAGNNNDWKRKREDGEENDWKKKKW